MQHFLCENCCCCFEMSQGELLSGPKIADEEPVPVLSVGIPVSLSSFLLIFPCGKGPLLAYKMKRRQRLQPGKPLWGISLQMVHRSRSSFLVVRVEQQIAIFCCFDIFDPCPQTWWHMPVLS